MASQILGPRIPDFIVIIYHSKASLIIQGLMIPYYLTKLWQMLVIPNSPSCVFAFWNGMTYETQIHIIELCVLCPTVKTFAVFRDKVRDKWADPDEGQSFGFLVISGCPGQAVTSNHRRLLLAFLAVFDKIETLGHERSSWTLVKTLDTEMLGSHETHQAWIFRRIAP